MTLFQVLRERMGLSEERGEEGDNQAHGNGRHRNE